MPSEIDVEKAKQLSWTSTIKYGVGEIVTYNLAIGSSGTDLSRCWEAHPYFHALPTFASLTVVDIMGKVTPSFWGDGMCWHIYSGSR
jgi:hypothetical protein